MNRYCKLFLLFICIYIPAHGYTQDLGLHVLSKDQIFLGRNPAIAFPENTIISLPEARGDLYLQSGPGPWWTTKADGTRELSLTKGWQGLERKNYQVETSWAIRSFFFGKKYKHFQFGFSHEIEGNSFIQFNKDLVGLLGFGNYGYLQKEPLAKLQPLDITINLGFEMFSAFGFQLGYQFGHFSIGGSLRYVSGLQELHTDIDQLEVDIRDPLTIKTVENWKVYSSSLLNEFTIDSIHLIPNSDVSILGRHPGVSGSLGIAYQTPDWLAAVQWRDMGTINWERGTVFSRSGSIDYSGIVIPDLLDIDKNVFNAISDSLKAIASIDRDQVNYRTSLRSTVLAEIQHNFLESWTWASAIQYRFNKNKWSLMTGFDYRVASFWKLGGQLIYDSRGIINAGIHTSIQWSAFNLFFNTDHIQGLYALKEANQISAHIGFSLMW